MNRKQFLLEVISGLLAVLFIYTAASKLMDLGQFEREIENQAFSKWLDPFIIYGLPPVELVTAAMLLIPLTRLAGLFVYTGLMVMFTVYVGLVTFHFYDRVPCSCAGVFKLMGWPAHLAFNVVFTALAVLGTYMAIKESNDQRSGPVA